MMVTGNPLGAVCVEGKPCNLGKDVMLKYSDKQRDLGPPMSDERVRKLNELIRPVQIRRVGNR